MDKLKLWFLNNKKIIIIIVLILVIVIGGLWFIFYSIKDKENSKVIDNMEDVLPIEDVLQNDDIIEVIEYIYVDIKGYVNKPGVYKFDVNSNSRVSDLITNAGGLKKGANTSNINLAMKLFDEMTVIIYSNEEISKYIETKSKETLEQEICNNSKINDACIESNNDQNISSKININIANKDELMSLTGIGESKALAIIEYRNSNGLFKTIDEIMNVSGIGDSVFQSIKEHITVE